MLQPTLGLDGGHATGPGGGDSLPEDGILNIAASEYAWNVRSSGVGVRLDVPLFVEIDLAFKDVGVWIVADRYKQAIDIQLRRGLRPDISELQSGNAGIFAAQYFIDDGIENKIDFGIL